MTESINKYFEKINKGGIIQNFSAKNYLTKINLTHERNLHTQPNLVNIIAFNRGGLIEPPAHYNRKVQFAL